MVIHAQPLAHSGRFPLPGLLKYACQDEVVFHLPLCSLSDGSALQRCLLGFFTLEVHSAAYRPALRYFYRSAD